MSATPMFFAAPQPDALLLGVAPAVASWDRAGSKGQLRLATFLDNACELVAREMYAAPGPLALRLDVGLPDTIALFHAHDLDNYLLPLARELTKRTGRPFASAQATKRHSASSFLAVGPALPATTEPEENCAFDVTVSASSETAAYKEEIRDQIGQARTIIGDGVMLDLAFVVGPTRTWTNLWKPTIDALGPILGRDPGATEWNTRDGRITELGLHCVIDPSAGNTVRIALRAASATTSRPPASN
jgi:hypothetical protein